MRLRTLCVPLAAPLCTTTRAFSEVKCNYDGTATPPWPAAGEAPKYPPARADHPLPKPRMRKTQTEWMFYHGHGGRLGVYGPSREIADFEFADGTPSSISGRRYAFKHHQDYLLVQLIRAGAVVERYAAHGLLPRVPGTAEQRDWDPAIPLFLEDVDEHGRPPPTPLQGQQQQQQQQQQVNNMMCARMIDERMGRTAHTPNELANRHEGEKLEPNTMFASYDPSAFVSDHVKMRDDKRPYWSRRRWALTDKFLVPKSPKAKNTIKDE